MTHAAKHLGTFLLVVAVVVLFPASRGVWDWRVLIARACRGIATHLHAAYKLAPGVWPFRLMHQEDDDDSDEMM